MTSITQIFLAYLRFFTMVMVFIAIAKMESKNQVEQARIEAIELPDIIYMKGNPNQHDSSCMCGYCTDTD